MRVQITVKKYSPIFGILASLIMAIGLVIPQFNYINQEGSGYSILNHFISELGWIGVSNYAYIFNTSLILSGVFYALFTYGITSYFHGFWGRITMFLGVATSICCSLVGLFPVQSNSFAITFHLIAASMFFSLGYFTFLAVIVMLIVNRNKVIPKKHLLFYIITPLYIIPWLNMVYDFKLFKYLNISEVKVINRPSVWVYPVIEWAIVILALINIIFISFYFLIRFNLSKSITNDSQLKTPSECS